MVIREVFLNHKGGRYIHKTHSEKLDSLCSHNGFTFLKEYLEFVHTSCPNHFFQHGPRSSCLKFHLVEEIHRIDGHEISNFAKYGLEVNKERFADAHSRVQNFLLEHDKYTVSMEIPLWLLPEELAGYYTLFKSKDVLTGHIDLLRIEHGNIWVWDYKPNAQKEKYAATQIFFYAYMLSKRTGISLQRIKCGYFDKNYTFVFEPDESYLYKLNKQKTLVIK